jgi:hypothetical protein
MLATTILIDFLFIFLKWQNFIQAISITRSTREAKSKPRKDTNRAM